MKDVFIHSSAVVDEGAMIGCGTQIWHFSHVMGEAIIGKCCKVGQNVFVANHVSIGDNVKIQNNVSIYEGVYLEDDVFCGPSMTFTNVLIPRSAVVRNTSADYLQTRVRRGASIGANATIVCGSTLGEHCMVGAGAVVTHDVPAHALVLGVPARVVGYVCTCGERVVVESQIAKCEACGHVFLLKTEQPEDDGVYSWEVVM